MIKKLQSFSSIAVANIFASLISFIYSVLIRRYLSTYEIGIYTSVNLVVTYLGFAQLGLLNAYNRDYPQMLGAGKGENEVKHLKSTVFTFLLLVYGILSVGCIIAGGIAVATDHYYYGLGLTFSGLTAGASAFFTFIDFTNKADKKFNRSALMTTVRSIAYIGIGIFLILKVGYVGLFIGMLFSYLIADICNLSALKGVKISFDFKLAFKQIKSGITLLLNNLAWTVMHSVDKFVVMALLTVEELGVYSVALMGFSTMVLIPQSVSQVFYVTLSREYGEKQDRNLLVNSAVDFTRIIGAVDAIAAVAVYFIFPEFIKICMPEYTDCIRSTQIMVLGVAIYGTTMLNSNVLSILKRNTKLIVTTIVLCGFNLIFSTVLVFMYSKSIDSVAIGTSLSYALYAMIMLWIATKEGNVPYWSSFVKTILPTLLVVISIIAVDIFNVNDIVKMLICLTVAIVIICIFNITYIKKVIKRRKS